jgi:REP element-mobilizing transposase RayT
MCRGDRREAIFEDDTDRECFVETLAQASKRAGWLIHAYVLMGNHYHLLVETPDPNLVRGMTWFQTTYTVSYNARRRTSGHLFVGRYKAVLVETPDGGSAGDASYFPTLVDDIHLNPIRADGRSATGAGTTAGRTRTITASSGRRRSSTPVWQRSITMKRKKMGEMKKSADEKSLIAAIVREETTVKASWVAEKLQMKSVANVTRASKAIAHRMAGDRRLKRIRKKILANISS